MGAEEKRTRAIKGLQYLRDELKRQQQRHPHPGSFTPAIHAKQFNDSVELLADQLGWEWVGSVLYTDRSITPKGKRKGEPPFVDAVYRDKLLTDVRNFLGKIGVEE